VGSLLRVDVAMAGPLVANLTPDISEFGQVIICV
jgi:hypothetical protein